MPLAKVRKGINSEFCILFGVNLLESNQIYSGSNRDFHLNKSEPIRMDLKSELFELKIRF